MSNHISLTWKMHSFHKYTAKYNVYNIEVLGIHWIILIGDQVIDTCFYHPNVANDSTQAKVQAERAIAKLISEK